MKNFSFDGRLGSDAEVKETKGGKPYVRFSVANNSFSGGVESTEWIDVTSYDPYVVENRAKYLKKGTYVIINGDVRFDVKFKENKLWKNIYVTAYSIDTPSFGKKDDEQAESAAQTVQEAQVAQVARTAPAAEEEKATVAAPTYTANVAPQPAVSTVGVGDDDLPF